MAASPDCRFCDIISGKHEAEVIFEDNDVIAFLDQAPHTSGHTLVLTREHYDNLLQVPPGLLSRIFERVQSLSKTLMKALKAQGVLIVSNVIVQQTVPHLHIHIVPRWEDDQLDGFSTPNPVVSRLSDIAEKIRRELYSS